MGPTWVLLAPTGPHVGPMNLAIRDGETFHEITHIMSETNAASIRLWTQKHPPTPSPYTNYLVQYAHVCVVTLGRKSILFFLLEFLYYTVLFIIIVLCSPIHDSPLHVHLVLCCTSWPWINWMTPFLGQLCVYVGASDPWKVKECHDQLLEPLDWCLWSADLNI